MKIQIDTTAKTIKLESGANLSDLFDFLEKIFPGGEWKSYKLETSTIIQQWSNPIVIDRYNPYPWYSEPIYCTGPTLTIGTSESAGKLVTTESTTTGTMVLKPTVQNFEVN